MRVGTDTLSSSSQLHSLQDSSQSLRCLRGSSLSWQTVRGEVALGHLGPVHASLGAVLSRTAHRLTATAVSLALSLTLLLSHLVTAELLIEQFTTWHLLSCSHWLYIEDVFPQGQYHLIFFVVIVKLSKLSYIMKMHIPERQCFFKTKYASSEHPNWEIELLPTFLK